MKILIILSFAFATAASQGFFGGREGLTDDVVGRVAGRFSQSLDRLPVSGRLPNFANLPHPGRFSNFFDFLVSKRLGF